MRILGVLGLLVLMGCGADGDPIRPERPTITTNIGIGPNGITTRSRVGVKAGPVSIGVGL